MIAAKQLRGPIYKAISDAFYEARDAGRTMTDAANAATTAVLAVVDAGRTDPNHCPRLGDLVCTRTDAHDPDAVGGHTYAASGAPDKHDAPEDAAERTRG